MVMTPEEIEKLKKTVRLYVTYHEATGWQSEMIACCDYHILTWGNDNLAKVKIADKSFIPCEECECDAGESPFSSGKLFIA